MSCRNMIHTSLMVVEFMAVQWMTSISSWGLQTLTSDPCTGLEIQKLPLVLISHFT